MINFNSTTLAHDLGTICTSVAAIAGGFALCDYCLTGA